jgi:hypothetical protein
LQIRDVGEVRRQPAAQALGLADVDDSSVRIPESVHAGLDRDGPGRGAIRCGIWHVSRLVVDTGRGARWDLVAGFGCWVACALARANEVLVSCVAPLQCGTMC